MFLCMGCLKKRAWDSETEQRIWLNTLTYSKVSINRRDTSSCVPASSLLDSKTRSRIDTGSLRLRVLSPAGKQDCQTVADSQPAASVYLRRSVKGQHIKWWLCCFFSTTVAIKANQKSGGCLRLYFISSWTTKQVRNDLKVYFFGSFKRRQKYWTIRTTGADVTQLKTSFKWTKSISLTRNKRNIADRANTWTRCRTNA